MRLGPQIIPHLDPKAFIPSYESSGIPSFGLSGHPLIWILRLTRTLTYGFQKIDFESISAVDLNSITEPYL